MKKILLFILLACSILTCSSQSNTITLSFMAQDAQSHNNVSLQGVYIRNISVGCDTTIFGPAPSIVLTNSLGINENEVHGPGSFLLMPCLQDPVNGTTLVYIRMLQQASLDLAVLNVGGRKIAACRNELEAGIHKFQLSGSNDNLLILNVTDGNTSKSIKLVSTGKRDKINEIRYLGSDGIFPAKAFAPKETSGFIFHLGDQLSFTATATGYHDETLTAAPLQSTEYTFQMTAILPDGYYVTGAATAFPDVDTGGIMRVTRNEVTSYFRPSLLERYIPIKAGAGGFNIVQVSGSIRNIIGPGGDFSEVAPTADEPKNGLQRGSYTETSATFTVPADGMYHVVMDYELGKVAVAKVDWGIIGSATPAGWITSTDLTGSAFDLVAMNWSISGLALAAGDWKLRYSNGWKIILDTIIDNGGGQTGVSVNTNLGGAVNSLEPGGSNIINTVPGIYDFSLDYTLGTGYTATLTKTGKSPLPY